MTGRPRDVANRPDYRAWHPRAGGASSTARGRDLMDALSDVLRAVRLTGAVFFDVHASEPWVAETPQGGSIVGAIFPGADHLIPYHVITGGACVGGLIGQGAVALAARR